MVFIIVLKINLFFTIEALTYGPYNVQSLNNQFQPISSVMLGTRYPTSLETAFFQNHSKPQTHHYLYVSNSVICRCQVCQCQKCKCQMSAAIALANLKEVERANL